MAGSGDYVTAAKKTTGNEKRRGCHNLNLLHLRSKKETGHDQDSHHHDANGKRDTDTALSEKLQALGTFMSRYGLVVVFAWIGAMKFSAYEATAIQLLVANSPLMSWLDNIFSVQAFSNWLGVLEIAIAVMIAAKPISAQISAAGSALAAGCS